MDWDERFEARRERWTLGLAVGAAVLLALTCVSGGFLVGHLLAERSAGSAIAAAAPLTHETAPGAPLRQAPGSFTADVDPRSAASAGSGDGKALAEPASRPVTIPYGRCAPVHPSVPPGAPTLRSWTAPAGSDLPVRGIDVSHYQGSVDWQKVRAAGVSFVLIKATEGAVHVDPCFAYNWRAARAVGLPRGAYHVYDVGPAADAQAAHFVSTLAQFDAGELAPILDLEDAILKEQDVSADEQDVRRWLAATEGQLGLKPKVYGSYNVFHYVFGADPFPGHDIWLAEYTHAPVHQPASWPDWTFWQFSSGLAVEGIASRVDGSVFRGSEAEFAQYLRQRGTGGGSPTPVISSAPAGRVAASPA